MVYYIRIKSDAEIFYEKITQNFSMISIEDILTNQWHFWSRPVIEERYTSAEPNLFQISEIDPINRLIYASQMLIKPESTGGWKTWEPFLLFPDFHSGKEYHLRGIHPLSNCLTRR
jgi:hypothetical protein